MAFDFKKEYKEYYLPPVTPTIGKMKAFAAQGGLSFAIYEVRKRHEIYLSDPRKTATERIKTVIRYPVE